MSEGLIKKGNGGILGVMKTFYILSMVVVTLCIHL